MSKRRSSIPDGDLLNYLSEQSNAIDRTHEECALAMECEARLSELIDMERERDELRTETPRARLEWQPMEMAPRDGELCEVKTQYKYDEKLGTFVPLQANGDWGWEGATKGFGWRPWAEGGE